MEKDGYIELKKSKQDARSLCVKITDKGKRLNEKNTELGQYVHEAVFRDFTEEEIERYYELSIKMMNGIGYLEDFFKEHGVNKNED